MKKVISMLLLIIVTLTACPLYLSAAKSGVASTETSYRENSYLSYFDKNKKISISNKVVSISTNNKTDMQNCNIIDNPTNKKEKCISLHEDGWVEYSVDVEEEGLYNCSLDYYLLQSTGTSAQIEILIDNRIPFIEAEYIALSCIYKDKEAPGSKKDSNENDLSPLQQQVFQWQTTFMKDYSGIFRDPFYFRLTKGIHTIKIYSVREPIILGKIKFSNKKQLLSYKDTLEKWQKDGLKKVDISPIRTEAEIPYLKSDSVLYGRTDRSSSITVPQSPSKIRINTIGGNNWNSDGQWIEWKVKVPSDGLYNFSMRARQNIMSGFFVTRELSVNGQIPFKEARDIRIGYKMDWQIVNIPYLIALKKGSNIIRLTATPGVLSDMISEVDDCLYQLNSTYRKIIMITSTSPDTYRDYQLDKIIPEVYSVFEKQAVVLRNVDQDLVSLTGKRGSMNGILQSLAKQLEDFYKNKDTLQKRVTSFRDNIAALGAWLISAKQEPLEIDAFFISSEENLKMRANSNFLGSAWHEMQMFFYSFIEDYNNIGGTEIKQKNITVWVQTGRDQANIIKDLILNNFSSKKEINVNLKLVQGQLLAATVSGRGPDVALQVGVSEPVNYALRKACVPLSKFSNFQEVAKRFRDSAMVPFKFNGEVYGLPETQTFPMLFYRKDVFDDLNLAVPQTWAEVFKTVGVLQKSNMTMGVQPTSSIVGAPNGLSSLAMFLYQNNGSFYEDNDKKSGLSSDEAVNAFKTWVSLYVDYSMPVKYDAVTRFRTGEMPMIIEDYTLFNSLSVSAPEIRGLWDIAPVPGIPQTDGSINRRVGSTGLASMMLSAAKDKESSWEFIDWWTSEETQLAFGKNIESYLGPSARYPTANIKAFSQLPWPAKEFKTLSQQWKNVNGIPEVAGGYFTARHINNAFRRVLTYNDNPKETLLDYVRNIDKEISYKRHEIGLDEVKNNEK